MTKGTCGNFPHLLGGNIADWRRSLAIHYQRLGRLSRRQRFLATLSNLSLQQLADRATPDIILSIEAEGRIVGVVEIFKGSNNHAEIGLSVEDAFQGKGYGRLLFLNGLSAARRIGIRTADLIFASENIGIRHLVTAVGGKVLQNGSECETHIDLAKFRINEAAQEL